jgi:DNA-binding IclR family transcriptional regulator
VLGLGTGYLRSDPLVERATPLAIQTADRCGERVNISVRDGDDLVYVIRVPRRVTSPEATMVGRRLPMPLLAGGRAILSTWPAAEAEAVVRRARFAPRTARTETDPDRILARIKTARVRGFDVNDEEVLHGDIVVAAPVRDRNGRGIAAVHIAVSTVDWRAEDAAQRLAPLAIETANALSWDGLSG